MKFVSYIIISMALLGCGLGTVSITCVCTPDISRYTDTELFPKLIEGVGTTRAEAVKDAREVCDRYVQYNTLNCL